MIILFECAMNVNFCAEVNIAITSSEDTYEFSVYKVCEDVALHEFWT